MNPEIYLYQNSITLTLDLRNIGPKYIEYIISQKFLISYQHFPIEN